MICKTDDKEQVPFADTGTESTALLKAGTGNRREWALEGELKQSR